MGLKKWLKKKQKSWEKNTNRFFNTLGAKNVTAQFNVKKLTTSPKKYFTDLYEDSKDDLVHAVGVYKQWVTGDWSNLGKQGTADTRKAFGLKKDKKQEKQAEALGQAYEDYDKGDLAAANKTLAEGDLGFVSDVNKKAQPYVEEYGDDAIKYGRLASDLYSDAQTGGPEGRERALEHVKKADIKYVSDGAGYAQTGLKSYDQAQAGDYSGAARTVKEGDMGFLSDLGAAAEQGAKAYEKGRAEYETGRAEYEKGKEAYDAGQKAGGSLGDYAVLASGYANQADAALSKTKATVNDFKKQTKARKDTDRSIARLQTGNGDPKAMRPPTPSHPGGGLGNIINDLLKAFGLAA